MLSPRALIEFLPDLLVQARKSDVVERFWKHLIFNHVRQGLRAHQWRAQCELITCDDAAARGALTGGAGGTPQRALYRPVSHGRGRSSCASHKSLGTIWVPIDVGMADGIPSVIVNSKQSCVAHGAERKDSVSFLG